MDYQHFLRAISRYCEKKLCPGFLALKIINEVSRRMAGEISKKCESKFNKKGSEDLCQTRKAQ